MRQVLAMKPLASAMRFVSLVHGTKQSGSAGGPDTTFGPAALAVRAMLQRMETLASSPNFLASFIGWFLPIVGWSSTPMLRIPCSRDRRLHRRPQILADNNLASQPMRVTGRLPSLGRNVRDDNNNSVTRSRAHGR